MTKNERYSTGKVEWEDVARLETILGSIVGCFRCEARFSTLCRDLDSVLVSLEPKFEFSDYSAENQRLKKDLVQLGKLKLIHQSEYGSTFETIGTEDILDGLIRQASGLAKKDFDCWFISRRFFPIECLDIHKLSAEDFSTGSLTWPGFAIASSDSGDGRIVKGLLYYNELKKSLFWPKVKRTAAGKKWHDEWCKILVDLECGGGWVDEGLKRKGEAPNVIGKEFSEMEKLNAEVGGVFRRVLERGFGAFTGVEIRYTNPESWFESNSKKIEPRWFSVNAITCSLLELHSFRQLLMTSPIFSQIKVTVPWACEAGTDPGEGILYWLSRDGSSIAIEIEVIGELSGRIHLEEKLGLKLVKK